MGKNCLLQFQLEVFESVSVLEPVLVVQASCRLAELTELLVKQENCVE